MTFEENAGVRNVDFVDTGVIDINNETVEQEVEMSPAGRSNIDEVIQKMSETCGFILCIILNDSSSDINGIGGPLLQTSRMFL